jgi:hypothetical protein
VEQPSGFLDGQYARVLATLRQKKYRETLEQIAALIIGDGMEHSSRFRQIQWFQPPWRPDRSLEPQPRPTGKS